MNEALKKANEALLEGDREGVLKFLEHESPHPEVLWLRANAVLDDEERIALLTELANDYSNYTDLAGEYLDRELEFQRQLDEDPAHYFWKKPTWKKILAQKYWIFGLILSLIMGVSLINFESQRKEEFQQEIAQVEATQTEEARFAGKNVVEYAAGTLSIINVEDPTQRTVTLGSTQNDQYIPAAPASGTRFLAVQVSFQCSLALCEKPPQVNNIQLELINGKNVSYQSSSQPFLVEFPPKDIPRISQGEYAKIWFVFEVPRSTSPESLCIIVEGQEEPQFLSWPVH